MLGCKSAVCSILLVCFFVTFVAATKQKRNGRKITFSTSTSVDTRNVRYNPVSEPAAGTEEYYVNQGWVSVSRSGYEREGGSLAEVMNYHSDYDEEDLLEGLQAMEDGTNYNDEDHQQDDLMMRGGEDMMAQDTFGDGGFDYNSITPPPDGDGDGDGDGELNLAAAAATGDKLTEAFYSFRDRRHTASAYDTRTRVVEDSSTGRFKFPYTAMAKIDVGCTGTFISYNAVLTAAHCIYNNNQWYRNLDVWRSKGCDPKTGFHHPWYQAVVFKGWHSSRLRSYDIALIMVSKNSPATMSFNRDQWRLDPSLALHMTGYPSHASANGCMYSTTCSQQPSLCSTFFMRYSCTASQGNDGGALYTSVRSKKGKYRHVVQGVHIESMRGSRRGSNRGVRLTPAHAEQIKKWIELFKKTRD